MKHGCGCAQGWRAIVGMWLVLLAAGAPALAAPGLQVQVIKERAEKRRIEVAVQPADETGRAAVQVLVRDLERSGWFTVTAAGAVFRVEGSGRTDGHTLALPLTVRVAGNASVVWSREMQGAAAQYAAVAHCAADAIVEAITGVPGIASTRVVMVGARAGRRDIFVCDADGGNLAQVTQDASICVSPKWAGAGAEQFYYTSFRGGFPDIYRVNLRSRERRRMSSFPGINTGAELAPDGQTLVLTLSKDGNPDLYMMSVGGGTPVRLTRTQHAAEASGSWSPDGREVVYVSDRSGSPQLYISDVRQGNSRRLTYQGAENVAPDWGPDGRITYCSKRDGVYRICVTGPTEGDGPAVSPAGQDHEDPAWARDSRHIVCTRTSGFQTALYILDTLGDSPVRLVEDSSDWYAPDWSR